MNLVEILLITRSDSPGSIAIRGLIWLAAVLILAAGIDNGRDYTKIKADAGWFFLFLFTIGVATFALFGFAPTF